MQEVERRKIREEQQHKDRGRDLCQEDVQFVGEIHGALTQHFGPLTAAFMRFVLFKVGDGYLWRTTALTLC